MSTIRCDDCGKTLDGETPKLVTRLSDGQIFVRHYCVIGNCPNERVKEFTDSGKCVWCDASISSDMWKLGGLGEPYCGERCYIEAGRAMYSYEFRRGNI